MYKERDYRRLIKSDDLVSFEVVEKETDLLISASKKLNEQARQSIVNYRLDLEKYIDKHGQFKTSLTPVRVGNEAPGIVKAMAAAARKASVGPMAAVAGAIAEFVGKDLLKFSEQVIVENGGDIFIRTLRKRTLGVYAGDRSPFTGKLAVEIAPSELGMGICTSSGTVSHSLSFGNADAVVIMSEDACLADAAATATGNIVKSAGDIEKAIVFARSVKGVTAALVLIRDKMGSWGEITLV